MFSPGANFITGFNFTRPTFFFIVAKVFFTANALFKTCLTASKCLLSVFSIKSHNLRKRSRYFFYRQSKIRLCFIFNHVSLLQRFFCNVLACFCNLNIVIFFLFSFPLWAKKSTLVPEIGQVKKYYRNYNTQLFIGFIIFKNFVNLMNSLSIS